MSNQYGPRIVTDGLVLCLDAGNSKSYPGSGTVWNDLSGNNNHGTLTNGPTYSSSNKGSIVFDGINDSVLSFPSLIGGSGSRTVICTFKSNSSLRTTLCDTRNYLTGAGWAMVVNRTSIGNITYFHAGGSILEVNGKILLGQWYSVCVTYNNATSIATLYLNGKPIGTPSTLFSVITSYGYNGGIGKADSSFSNFFKGNISQVIMYNRSLSENEVSQNYNATKGRFV